MANFNDSMNEMKRNAKNIIQDQIEKSKDILKPMLPPTPFPTSTQSSDDDIPFSQMSQEQFDIETQ